MTREDAREAIRRDWRGLIATFTGKALAPMNGEDSYICPLCEHGTHGDGITYDPKSRDHNGLKCFGCGFSGDIIDLYQQANGVDFNTALQALADKSGIDLARESAQTDFSQADRKEAATQGKSAQRPDLKRGRVYYEKCTQALAQDHEAIAYLKGRGISLETAQAHGVGYDGAWRSPTALGNGKNPPQSKRIIIPMDAGHYMARAIEPPRTDADKRFQKMNEGEAALFNEACLSDTTDKPVFIVEGAIDALSILEVGGLSLALNSTSNVGLLIATLEANPTKKTLVLSLDRDKAGRTAERELREGLKRLNTPYITADICNGCKDANEALQKDRAQFMALVDIAQNKTSARPDAVQAYIDTLMAADIEQFKTGCAVKTGFANLDRQSGGLFNGLYVIAAISSLGKTTLAHQIADNLAMAGRDVVYFSLEQSTLELVTKSLARITAKRDRDNATTALAIRCGNFGQNVQSALEEYRGTIGDRLSIIEGNFNCTVGYIGDYLRQYIHKTGCRPFVFVDYLQILQPEDDASRNAKETVDHTITELKRLSRALGLTIFVICSVNRANYLTPIDFESLKESGSIEFTADCIWGLQLKCLSQEPLFTEANKIKEKRDRVREAKAETPRQIELVCLKNRSGKPSFSCFFDYFPAHDLFVEADGDSAADDFDYPGTRREAMRI